MKLSTLSAKLTGSKAATATKVLAVTAIAGAAMTMAVPAAQAQRVAFGIQVGVPAYVAPAPEVVYTQPAYYYGGDRYAAWRAHEAHEAWERREAWEHARRFDGDRGYDRRDYGRERFEHRDRDRR